MTCLGCGGHARVVRVRSGMVDGRRVCRRITLCMAIPGCPPGQRKRGQIICDEGPTRRTWIPPDSTELPKHRPR